MSNRELHAASKRFLRPVTATIVSILVVAGTGCERQSDTETAASAPVEQAPTINAAAAESLTSNYWQAGQARVIEAQSAVDALGRAVTTLLDAPTEDNLEAAKLAWLDAHRAMATALPYIRVAFAPAELQQQGAELVLALDSWPVQAGYLDTVPGYSDSGIVNDTAIELTLTNLRKQHRLTAHEEASTGFHALEVMLWGPTSERTAAQFEAASAGEAPKAQATNRRRALTRLIAQGMEEDIHSLVNRWPASANDLSQRFLAQAPTQRMQTLRAAHVQLLRDEVLARMPESSESDVESGRAGDSKQAILAMLRTLQQDWLPESGTGLADLMLDQRQSVALEEAFALLEVRLLKMEDPVELAHPDELQRCRQQLEQMIGLMSGETRIPVPAEDMTPVSLKSED